MSYKAFAKIKNHVEIEAIKSMTPEEINSAMNALNDKYTAVCAELEELQKKYDDLQDYNMQLQSIEVWTNKTRVDDIREAIEHLKADQLGRYKIVLPDVKEAIETLEAYADKLRTRGMI